LLMVGIFFIQFDILKTFVLDNIPQEKLLLFSAVLLVSGAVFILAYKYSKLKFILFLKEKLSGLKDGVMSVIHMKAKWPFLLYTLVTWVCYILMFWISIFAFEETSGLSFVAVLTTFVVGTIAIAFTNNGLGSYPFLVAEILKFYGISVITGSALGWIVWASQTIFTLILGLVSLFLLPLFNKQKN